MSRLKPLLIAGLMSLQSAAAFAQAGSMGLWPNYPYMGNQSYCSAYVNGNCVQTIPPGAPGITGNEAVPVDTHLPGGQFPQTELITVDNLAHISDGSERNFLRGADFLVNLWQRGVTFSALTPTTTTMTADGWGVYSSANTVTIAQDTTAADLAPALGVNGAMKVTRPSSTNTTAICVVQVLPQKESQKFIGKQAVFSFYAEALAGYKSTNNNVIASIAVYTAGDSATPGTNTDAFAKGTITGYTVLNPTSATVTTAPVLPITTAWARYSVTGAVPSTVSGTAVVGIGVQLCTPVYPASTGSATDGFLFGNAQLEVTTPATNVTILGANGVQVTVPGTLANTTPGGFTRRNPAAEWAYEQSYSYILKDGAATVYYYPGLATTTALAKATIIFPVTMREIPALTVGTTVSFAVTKSDGTAQACGTSIAGVASSITLNQATVLCTTGATALTAGQVAMLMGAATGGLLTYSAEP